MGTLIPSQPITAPRRYVLVRVTDIPGMAGLVAEHIATGPGGKGATWVEAWATAGRRRKECGGVWVVAEAPNAYEPAKPDWPRGPRPQRPRGHPYQAA